MTANTAYDVIVVGAGIIGLSMTLGLAKQGLKVALIDKGNVPQRTKASAKVAGPVEYSSRVSALSIASQTLLTDLGAWQHIERKQAYTKMHVWDQDGFGDILFDAKDFPQLINNNQQFTLSNKANVNETCLGHIIENEQINIALYTALQAYSNASCLYDHTVAKMQANAEGAQITLANNQQIEAKLLIGADGANSKVRQTFKFKQTFWDYDHHAIVANVKTELPHNNAARQAFTPFGPLAFLPLPDAHQSSIVFSQQSDRANELMNMSNDDFEKSLLVAIDGKYGKVSLSTQRQSFPLRMRYAQQWTGTRVALVGDAAHTIHPLAGQGANLGLNDVAALLNIMGASTEEVGHQKALRKYERQQKSEALKVIATMEGFKQLFDGKRPLIKLMRNMGLATANKVPAIKKFFMLQAMG